MRRITISMLLLAATTTKAQKVWTLDECIDYAMQHSAAVMKSRVAADNARQDRGAAVGGFMPSLSASVGTQFSWGRNVDPETNTYSNNGGTMAVTMDGYNGKHVLPVVGYNTPSTRNFLFGINVTF